MAVTVASLAEFSLVPSAELVAPEQLVDVEVYVDCVDYLGTYEVSLTVTGGQTGALELEDLFIDTDREDYVFGAASIVSAVSLPGCKLGAMLQDGGVVVDEPAYLGTFTYRASADAGGVFSVTVREHPHSFLEEPNGSLIPSSPGEGALVGCAVECFRDEHCPNDGNDCTDESCTDNVCVYTNTPSGTPCDDGRWCTVGEECDGSGDCTGGDPRCKPGQICLEESHLCMSFREVSVHHVPVLCDAPEN